MKFQNHGNKEKNSKTFQKGKKKYALQQKTGIKIYSYSLIQHGKLDDIRAGSLELRVNYLLSIILWADKCGYRITVFRFSLFL